MNTSLVCSPAVSRAAAVLSALTFLCAAAAPAAVIVVAPTAASTGSLTITAPVSFTLTSGFGTDFQLFFALQNWVTSDLSQSFSRLSSPLAFTINGNAAIYGSGGGRTDLADNTAADVNSLGANDGYLTTGPINSPGAAGNVVTLLAGTYSLAAVGNFNPQATQTFSGNMFLTNIGGLRISNIVSAGAIPEPGTMALCLAAGAGLVIRARRRNA